MSAAPRRGYRELLTLALLSEFQNDVRTAGAEFLVLDIPNTTGRASFNSIFPDLAGTDLEGVLHVVSPLEKFAEHEGELIYWEQSHYHLTPLGNDLVADVLADYIRSNDLLTR